MSIGYLSDNEILSDLYRIESRKEATIQLRKIFKLLFIDYPLADKSIINHYKIAIIFIIKSNFSYLKKFFIYIYIDIYLSIA